MLPTNASPTSIPTPELDERPLLRAVPDRAQEAAAVLEHQRRHLLPVESQLHLGQVQRHHLVPDQLVDDRLREEDVLGAPVEAPQYKRDLLGSEPSLCAVNPRRSAKSTPVCIFIPPGGEVSTQVAQIVGFLREGR